MPVVDCFTNIAVGRILGYRASIILMCLMQAVLSFKKLLNQFLHHSRQTSFDVNLRLGYRALHGQGRLVPRALTTEVKLDTQSSDDRLYTV